MKILTLLTLMLTACIFAKAETESSVHLFILSGQSNMGGMKPETCFMPEAEKLFKDEKVVFIKVAKSGQPICRWLEEWEDIAKENEISEMQRKKLMKGGGVTLYQPILDEYKEILKKHPKLASVTFCWMQGERDANGGGARVYKDALKQLISKLRLDLERPDMNIVIGRISDASPNKSGWDIIRKLQIEIVNEDPSGAWVDCDDLNDKMDGGKMKNAVHYNRPDGYIMLGKRFARQGYALVKGEEPAEDGRP